MKCLYSNKTHGIQESIRNGTFKLCPIIYHMQPCRAKYMWAVWNIRPLELVEEEAATVEVVSFSRVKYKDSNLIVY